MRNFGIYMFLTWGGMTILGNFLKVLGTSRIVPKRLDVTLAYHLTQRLYYFKDNVSTNIETTHYDKI